MWIKKHNKGTGSSCSFYTSFLFIKLNTFVSLVSRFSVTSSVCLWGDINSWSGTGNAPIILEPRWRFQYQPSWQLHMSDSSDIQSEVTFGKPGPITSLFVRVAYLIGRETPHPTNHTSATRFAIGDFFASPSCCHPPARMRGFNGQRISQWGALFGGLEQREPAFLSDSRLMQSHSA